MTMIDPNAGSIALDEYESWIDAYDEAVANAEQWKQLADVAKRHIDEALGERGTLGTVNGRTRVRRKWIPGGKRFSQKEFRTDHPDMYDSYKREANGHWQFSTEGGPHS